MKHILITTIAAVVLVGCSETAEERRQRVLVDREKEQQERRWKQRLAPGIPDVVTALNVLVEGEGLFDSGKYSPDQQEKIFEENYENKKYIVDGIVTDVGTTAILGTKYITLRVKTNTYSHHFDVYPIKDFDILDYSKEQRLVFVGVWTYFGTGTLIHHGIKQAEELNQDLIGEVASPDILIKFDEEAKPELAIAKVEPPDNSIHEAAEKGKIATVKQHLAAGVDVNAKSKQYGQSPLHHAALGGQVGIVELLIENDADINAKTDGGYTPLDWADNRRIADLLRKHGGKTGDELKAEGK
jgi:hypothetical protein